MNFSKVLNFGKVVRKMKKRILLGMSGGTDSSVAAILLLEQGYEVVGMTFRFCEEGKNMHLQDAVLLANQLGIEHIMYDARVIFKKICWLFYSCIFSWPHSFSMGKMQ